MKGRLLLVEDDPDDLELTLAAFELWRFTRPVDVARDGEDVLRRLRAGPPPALVLLDLNIPKVSGLDVLERVRKDPRLAAVPFVVLSSSDDPKEKRRAAELGALAFLRKPFGVDAFGAVVKELEGILFSLESGKEKRR